MKTLLENKSIIAIVFLFILGMFIYNTFIGSRVSLNPGDLEASNVGVDLLLTLNELKGVNLDRSILSDQAFLEFSDFSTTIPEEPVGRPNPFDRFGRD